MQKLIRRIGVYAYLSVASSAGFFLAAPVNASPSSSPKPMQVRKHKNESVEQTRKRTNKLPQVRGTVLQSKQVKIKGSDLTNKVILLRTQKVDKILIIDAGRSDKRHTQPASAQIEASDGCDSGASLSDPQPLAAPTDAV